jgi:hypothetical protein
MKASPVLFVFLWTAAQAVAAPVTLVSVLTDRPVFSYVAQGLTQTRALSPGDRIKLEAGRFSGLGLKKVPLKGGSIYYLARFHGVPGLFVLGPDQVLILNESGQVVPVTLSGSLSVSGTVASGNFALGTAAAGGLTADWEAFGSHQSQLLKGGSVYRFLLGSPEEGGLGLIVSLKPWD